MQVSRRKSLMLILILPGCLIAGGTTRPGAMRTIEYAPGQKLCELANRKIGESSGLACGRLAKDVFWTHNDSGDPPVIYAFGADGKDLGAFRVQGAAAKDWEDMASFKIGKKAFLLLADVGDNARKRKTCELYIVREPRLPRTTTRPAPGKPAAGRVKVRVKIVFAYEDGPHDCESVAVDANGRKIYLATKETPLTAKIYELPLPNKSPRKTLKAKAVADLPTLFATAMDISPDGLRAVVLNYGAAYQYTRAPGQTWAKAFSQLPRQIKVPARRQGESICYGPDGKTLYLTSEKLPTPLWQVPVAKKK